MTTSRETHYIVKVEIVEVTNFFETTAYGSGSRPSGYTKEILDKVRQQHTVANLVTTQPTLIRACDMASAQLKLFSDVTYLKAKEVDSGTGNATTTL